MGARQAFGRLFGSRFRGSRWIRFCRMSEAVDFERAWRWYDRNSGVFAAGADAADVDADRRDFLALLKGWPRPRVLDVGCGTGRDLLAFRSAGCEVTGIDPSSAMIGLARKRLGKSARLLQCGVEEIRTPGRRWNGIWAMACLLHLPLVRQEPALAGLIRRLAPGGLLTAWVKSSAGQDARELIDQRGRPVCVYGEAHAARLMENARRGVTGRADVLSVPRRDSSGQRTTWLRMRFRRS